MSNKKTHSPLYTDMTSLECPICLDSLKNTFMITTPCNHSFCMQCFIKIDNDTCPMCRKPLFTKKMSQQKILVLNLRPKI